MPSDEQSDSGTNERGDPLREAMVDQREMYAGDGDERGHDDGPWAGRLRAQTMRRAAVQERQRHESRPVREAALAAVREGLRAVETVPAAALDEQKHETLADVHDGLESLEAALTHEVDQLDGGDEDAE